jgi:hypothetical protein
MTLLPLVVLLALVWLYQRRAVTGTVGAPDAVVAWAPATVVRDRSRWRVIRTLGLVEARRLARHPVVLAGTALAVMAFGLSPGAEDAQSYFELTGSGSAGLYLPPLVFLAAHLDATRSRRAGTGDLLDAAATDQVVRTLAACFAGVVAAGGVLLLVLAGYAWYRATGRVLPRWPGPFELVLLPLSVLGATALGTMAGRWLPWRGAGPPVLLVLVAVTVLLAADQHDTAPYFASFADLIDWEARPGSDIALPVHASAHAAYVLGLDAMAVVGAVLRDRRTRLWWGIGAAAVLWTAAMGVWQVS